MIVWMTIAIMTGLVAAYLAWPLVRAIRRSAPISTGSRSAHDITVYKDQLTEIDAELQRGVINEAEAGTARTEISRRLLALAGESGAGDAGAVGQSSHDGAGGVATRRFSPTVVAGLVALPVLALPGYYFYGSPGLSDQPHQVRVVKSKRSGDIDELIARVEAHLRGNPQDGRGWQVIAPVYMRLDRYGDAAEAYANAMRILGENSDRLAGFGEARVLDNNGIVGEPAKKAFERALVLDRGNLRSQFWLAVALEQDGKLSQAGTAYRALLARGGPDAPWRGLVNERLASILARTGKGLSKDAIQSVGGGPDKSGGTSDQAPGPTSEDVASAAKLSGGERAEMINRMVERLATRLEKEGGDLGGWLRLVRSYTVLGRRDDALAALKKARSQFQKDAKAIKKIDALAAQLGLRS